MLLPCFSSCCWYFMWVSGSSNTSHPVRTWSVPIWNISEKKEIQRTRAGMYIPQVRPFKGLKFNGLLIISRWCLLTDVMPPRAESVYSRYTPLHEATHWEGNLLTNSVVDLGKPYYICHLRLTCHFFLRMMRRRWLLSSWTRSIAQSRDLCLRFPNQHSCQ